MNNQEAFDIYFPLIEARQSFNISGNLDPNLIKMLIDLNSEYDSLNKNNKRKRILGIVKRFNINYEMPEEYVFPRINKTKAYSLIVEIFRKNNCARKISLVECLTGDKYIEGFTDDMIRFGNPLPDQYKCFQSLREIKDFLEMIMVDYLPYLNGLYYEDEFKIIADRCNFIYTNSNGDIEDVKGWEVCGPTFHLRDKENTIKDNC